MRKQVFATAVLCCLVFFVSAQKYHPDYQDGALWLKLKPAEELLTKKKEKLTVDDLRVLKPLKEKYKLKNVEKPFQKIRKTSPLRDTYFLTFDEVHEADKLIKELEKSGVLEYAEKVPINKTSVLPSDSSFSKQWHLAKIGAQAAWDIHTSSSNTIIAIVDDAVQTNHPDLAPNIWVNSKETPGNNVDDDGNGYIDDVNGWNFGSNNNNPNPPSTAYDHGTHVAGIASAASNNVTGIASIGFNARLMCIKASFRAGYVDLGYEGIIYAADNGANVINLSWGSVAFSKTSQNVINYALGKGCIIVAAAGNNYSDAINYPAAYDGVVSVAATDAADKKACFSNYNSKITISAPGDAIYSTTVAGGYKVLSGTSMASPLVAGLLALMHSYNPQMPNSDLIDCLKSSATNIDANNTTVCSDNPSSCVGKLGAGRINAAAAMECVRASFNRAPIANFSANYTSVSVGGSVTFSDSSVYAPTSWLWSFPGGTPSSSTERNPPKVVYTHPNIYPVTLTVSNAVDSSSKTINITVNPVSNCDLLNRSASQSWTPKLYNALENSAYGLMNGLNILEDKQKAMFFDASYTSAAYITNVHIWFGRASSIDLNKIVTIRAYDGTSGSPGDPIGSAVLTMGDIITAINNNVYVRADFLRPVTIPASRKFFISLDMSNLCWICSDPADPGDDLGIVSNMDTETIPSDTWEQQADGTWHRYNTEYSWPYNISLYIHPSLTNDPVIAKFDPSATTICTGSSVSFDATGSRYTAGLNWSFAGGSPSSATGNLKPTVTYNTPGNHLATLTVIGGGCSEERKASVVINVSENVTPTLTLSGSTDIPDVPVTFTANPTHGGLNPIFTFKKNGEVMQVGNSATWSNNGLKNGDIVSCTLTSDHSCVTSNIASSNSITINSSNTMAMTVLPVELLYFKGSSATGTNLLHWATASEINTDKFIIERSTNGATFYEIGKIKAKGESNTTLTYQFQDTRTGSAHYRLRILDKDGSYKFSQVIYLKGDKDDGLILWPNPAKVGQVVQLSLSGRNAKQEIVQVIDAFGKVIDKKIVAIKGEKLETVIPTQHLAPGLYFITITDETTGRVQKEKLMIIK